MVIIEESNTVKCPYIRDSISIEVEPADGELSKAIVTEYPHECLYYGCAAYQNGRCVRTA